MIDYQAKQIDCRIDRPNTLRDELLEVLPPEHRVESRNSIISCLGDTIANLQKVTQQVKIQ